MQTVNLTIGQCDPLVVQHFNAHAATYVDHELAVYEESIQQRLSMLQSTLQASQQDSLSLLDLGCGGGAFIDRFLSTFPQATAVGVDISAGMLSHNLANERKSLRQADLLALPNDIGRFDVIAIDTVMHHLIDRKGYAQTLGTIESFLRSLHSYLAPGGCLLIREIYHEFHLFDSLGTRLLYEVSKARPPQSCQKFLQRCGIYTAGVGVCFLTRRQWMDLFEKSGYQLAQTNDIVWPQQPYRKYGFSQSGDLHFLLKKSRPKI